MKADLRPLWRILEIDAWAEPEGGWTWNDAFTLKEFRSDAEDMKRVFLRELKKLRGRPLDRGAFYVSDDFEILEVRRRNDECPIWACQRMTPP